MKTKIDRDDLRQYCRNCTDAQLLNVYNDEKKRAKENKGNDTGRVAEAFAEEAKKVMSERGISHEQ